MHPSEVVVPLKVTNTDGEEFEVLECQTSILWPWDFLTWMWDSGVFLQWIADDPASAHQRNREYWQQCAHLDFYKRTSKKQRILATVCSPRFLQTIGNDCRST